MTDKEIGKTFREIAERGNTAKVKKNKNGGGEKGQRWRRYDTGSEEEDCKV